jgi:hypothetical protein
MKKVLLILSSLSLILVSACGSTSSDSSAVETPSGPVTKQEKLDYVAKSMVQPMSDLFHKWAGSDSERASKGLRLTLNADQSIATLKYDLHDNDYWSILWHQQYQTGQDFTNQYMPKYGNPWCRSYTLEIFAQLSYEFYSLKKYYPEWDIWPSRGLEILINNYDVKTSKDKYGNDLPDKVIDARDAHFGITMSDLDKVNWGSDEIDLGRLSTLTPLSIPNVGFCTTSFIYGAIFSD